MAYKIWRCLDMVLIPGHSWTGYLMSLSLKGLAWNSAGSQNNYLPNQLWQIEVKDKFIQSSAQILHILIKVVQCFFFHARNTLTLLRTIVKTTWHSSQSEQDQGLEYNAKANTHGEQECPATHKSDVNQEGWSFWVLQNDLTNSSLWVKNRKKKHKKEKWVFHTGFVSPGETRLTLSHLVNSTLCWLAPLLHLRLGGWLHYNSLGIHKILKNRQGRIHTFWVKYVCLINNIVLLNTG